MGRFFQRGVPIWSLSQNGRQNLRMAGRMPVVMIIYQYSLNNKHQDYSSSSACHFDILPAFLRRAFLETLNGLGELLYSTGYWSTTGDIIISLFQREEEAFEGCSENIIQYLDNEISSCVTTNMAGLNPLWDIEDRRRWGLRRWGHDFEDMRLWGQATLRTCDFEDKNFEHDKLWQNCQKFFKN